MPILSYTVNKSGRSRVEVDIAVKTTYIETPVMEKGKRADKA